MDDEDSDSEDDSEDEEEGGAGGPTLQARSSSFEFLLFHLLTVLKVILLTFSFCSHLQLRKVTHEGCVNRIRSMTQNPHICATWAESGYVQVSFKNLMI
jgi:ribosome assembly protein RRB1